jgi:type I restriction enzyme S subunit
MIKKQNIPKLRFPEFQNAPEWEEKPLSEVLDYERPDNYIVSTTNYGSEGIPVLTANKSFILGYTKEDFGIFEDTPVIIFDDFTTDNKYVDFAFKVKSSAIKILRRKGKNNLKMIFELMNQIKFEAAEHKRYYISEYQNLIVKLPKPAEQQKIADCLSSLDELITAQAQKVEALKTHKKALMWRLFPREGESIPRLRFPEFQNAPEWERKPLGDIFNFLRGSLFSKENIVENGTNKCIHYGELFTIYKEKIFEIKSSTNLENGQFSQNGDILMPSSDVTPEGLATASAIFEAGVIIGGDVNILRPKNQVSSLFISYLLNFSKKDIMKLVTGTTVKHIYNKDIAKLDIKIPLQLKEQQKIADCLSSLDELITAQAQKVEALKTHKKALMQRLFPDTGGK